MTIFEALRKDHDLQRDLLETIVNTSGDTRTRKNSFEALKHELKIHEDGEERYFYNPLFKDELTQEHARHGVAEHHEIDKIVEKLEKTEMDSPAWLQYAKKLKEKVDHHLEEEEHTFFQLAGKSLSEDDKVKFGEKYKEYVKANREHDFMES